MDPSTSGDPETPPRRETELTTRARTWDDAALQRALDEAGTDGWGPVAVLPSTGSTNADAAEQAREGCPEGFTVVADEQSSGRGRLDRVWESPNGAGLAMSVVLRPSVPSASWGWVPLLAGVAVVDALARQGMGASLKWPNDVVVDRPAHDGGPGPRKLGGLLVERVAEAEALVVGIGINTDLAVDELPLPRATSTRLEGVDVVRERLLVDILDELRRWESAWVAGAGDARRTGLLEAYAQRCLTLGRQVQVQLPGGAVLHGIAQSVDDSGRLVVRGEDGTLSTVSAGDVQHVR